MDALPDLSARKTMHRIFCVVLATQLLHLEATPCQPGEYIINGDCCPKCGLGSRVSKHCTFRSGTSCLPCIEGTFTDHPNGLTECLRCNSCDPEAHLRIKEPCTYTKNTLCSCIPGYFCSSRSEGVCELCQKHKVSPPGFMVTQPGSETSDTKFVSCPPKTFSATENASSCQSWTNCSEKGLLEKQTGNKTSDAVCAPHEHSHTTAIAACTITLALVLAGTALAYLIKRKRARKEIGTRQQELNGGYFPVQETEASIRKPMQETAQNLGEPTYAQT